MSPLLFCLSVSLLFVAHYSKTTYGLLDITKDCNFGRNTSQYLTNQMGASDIAVHMIRKKGLAECRLIYITNKDNYIMFVLEFLDWNEGEPHCRGQDSSLIVVARGSKEVNVCESIDPSLALFRITSKHNVSLVIKAHDLGGIKVTATTLRDPNKGNCYSYEIPCRYGSIKYCMTRFAYCDGNPNCGVKDSSDEEKNYCYRSVAVNPSMVLVGLTIGTITCVLLVALLRKLLPARKGTFIFKEDETLSDTDRANCQRNYEVFVRVLYGTSDVNFTADPHDTGHPPRGSLTLKKFNVKKKIGD
ncbi:UNVERIFIED_CONTAM: hypothetical protein PYX00_006211 [Menopon gallinae]|uniref:Uncharacterized protein n=1 Tax=Menopon gallinae TaxID=328185 RepID=A0AAW2HW50_9NEOP